METNKTEKIKNEIENTDEDISKLQIVIQTLKNKKDDLISFGLRDEYYKILDSCDSQIKLLEEVKESKDEYLNLNCLK